LPVLNKMNYIGKIKYLIGTERHFKKIFKYSSIGYGFVCLFLLMVAVCQNLYTAGTSDLLIYSSAWVLRSFLFVVILSAILIILTKYAIAMMGYLNNDQKTGSRNLFSIPSEEFKYTMLVVIAVLFYLICTLSLEALSASR